MSGLGRWVWHLQGSLAAALLRSARMCLLCSVRSQIIYVCLFVALFFLAQAIGVRGCWAPHLTCVQRSIELICGQAAAAAVAQEVRSRTSFDE